jgi:hypothetical protein
MRRVIHQRMSGMHGRGGDMIGYQEIGCHMVFDINVDFTRKA